MTVISFITISPAYAPFLRPPPKPHPRTLVWKRPPSWRSMGVDIGEVRVTTAGAATTLDIVNTKGMVVARVRSI